MNYFKNNIKILCIYHLIPIFKATKQAINKKAIDMPD